MNKILLFLLLNLVGLSISYSQQRPFITEWKTDNPGNSCDRCITIPTSIDESYNYTVDWGDGVIESGFTGNADHEYDKTGNYSVSITGDFPRIIFAIDEIAKKGDADKLLWVHQWGDIEWRTFNHAFYRCSYFNCDATDSPDLSRVTDMSSMFREARTFDYDMNHWNVSKVIDMNSMFACSDSFNQDIGNWDVSNVVNMNSMFRLAQSFNQDITSWDVAKVKRMRSMFAGAGSFNQDIGDWDVSNVLYMFAMFDSADSFNQDIGNWDVSKVIDMNSMFACSDSFNQDIGNWDVSKVRDMSRMFICAESFNQDIGNWDVSDVTRMDFMFRDAASFNQDIGNWDVSNVIYMGAMFGSAREFNQDIGDWDVSKVRDMHSMFGRAVKFNQDISTWDVSTVTDMNSMFRHADSFNQNIGTWEISSVNHMYSMFDNSAMDTSSYDATLNGWEAQDASMDSITIGAESLVFCKSKEARDRLINEKGWTFVGDMISENEECKTTSSKEIDQYPIRISPNPFSDFINIQYDSGKNLQVNLFTPNGKLIKELTNASNIKTTELSVGHYILQMTDLSTGNRKIERLVLLR